MPHSLAKLSFLTGNLARLQATASLRPLPPFAPAVLAFLGDFSRALLRDSEAKAWPDVVSLGFWCRPAALAAMQAPGNDGTLRCGRGLAFHIAPGNVAANFAYSLLAGLLTGNANVVRLPGRDYPQTVIIVRLLNATLADHPAIAPYICLVRYDKQQEINDALSALCDVRIIWGGDSTIARLRQSPLPPRALDIAFADRYSIAAIDSDRYLAYQDKPRLAQAFYNDTLLNDQNACSSPSLVVWLGQQTAAARALFWQHFADCAAARYQLEPVAAVNKQATLCLLSAAQPGVKKVSDHNNLLMRVELPTLHGEALALRGNCGFFMEYMAQTLDEITPVCNARCQTLATFGIEPQAITDWLARNAPRGIDRIVPIGHTLDFTLQWDGYDLLTLLTRVVVV